MYISLSPRCVPHIPSDYDFRRDYKAKRGVGRKHFRLVESQLQGSIMPCPRVLLYPRSGVPEVAQNPPQQILLKDCFEKSCNNSLSRE